MSAAVSISIVETPEVWARLESSLQWTNLTDQQKTWVAQFITTGSALSATQAAYKATPKNARVLSYEIVKNPRILSALAAANGTFTVKTENERLAEAEQRARRSLIRLVKKQLKAAEEGSTAAQKFSAQLERLKIGIKAGRHEIDDEPKAEPKHRGRPRKDAQTSGVDESRVPEGATPLRDADGVIKGYRTAEGSYIQLADVEVADGE